MDQTGGDLDLAQEALCADGRRELGEQHLYSYGTIVPDVPRLEDHGHPPTTQLIEDLVSSLNSARQSVT
jgi:hypothetical protein